MKQLVEDIVRALVDEPGEVHFLLPAPLGQRQVSKQNVLDWYALGCRPKVGNQPCVLPVAVGMLAHQSFRPLQLQLQLQLPKPPASRASILVQ